MADAHKNFAYSNVTAAPSPATSGTSLTVSTGDGAKFPAPPFNATVWPNGALPLSTNSEIVRVTAIVGDVLTITRTQESTSARTIVNTDQIAATITSKALTDIENSTSVLYNVKGPAYGAKGDNSTDDTTAIQAAIDAAHNATGGGVVFFPAGTYKISGVLTLYSSITLKGESEEVSIINQTSTTANGVTANNAASITLADIMIKGPASGSGKGIVLDWSTAGNNPYHNFHNIIVKNFGSDGLYLKTPIVSHFDKVIAVGNGGSGFNFYSAGTSNTLTSCYANANTQYGYHFVGTVYTTLVGCAADANGMGYMIDGAQGIAMIGCGTESNVVRDATYDGTGVKINNSFGIGLYNCWNYANPAVAYWITGGAQAITLNGCYENSPVVGATASFKADSGTVITLSDPRYTTATSIGASSYTQPNDNTGAMRTNGKMYNKGENISGSSGTLILSASPDGGEFNLFSDATGKLAIYGSAGATLDLNLFDGSLYTNSVLRLSNGGTLQNTRVQKRTGTVASSATPTINTDNVDFYSITALAVNITSMTTNLSGTPTEGQTLWIAITGTAARTIAWGTSFEASTVALPTTTVTTARLDVGFIWNTVTSKWRCVAVA